MGAGLSKPKYDGDISKEGIEALCHYHQWKYSVPVNVGVFGGDGNGKSATVNSIGKTLISAKGEIAGTGVLGSGGVTTSHLRTTLKINTLPSGKVLMNIWDSRGLPNRAEFILPISDFLVWCCQGYVEHNTPIKIGDYLSATKKICVAARAINVIVVVQSLVKGGGLQEYTLVAIRAAKDKLQLPIAVCFTHADNLDQDSDNMKTKTMQLLGVSETDCFVVKNYCSDIRKENDPERDKQFISMLHSLLYRLDGADFQRDC